MSVTVREVPNPSGTFRLTQRARGPGAICHPNPCVDAELDLYAKVLAEAFNVQLQYAVSPDRAHAINHGPLS